MTALDKIAFHLNRRDEVPNQELARQLASSHDTGGIEEIAENLWNKNKNIGSDCLKVLYEIGYIQPELISPYTTDFLKLLSVKDNRMIWGGMIAMATIADLKYVEIGQKIDEVISATEKGSLITKIWGMRVLAKTVSKDPSLIGKIIPVVLRNLQTCLARDIPTHLESILPMINDGIKVRIMEIIENRKKELTSAQASRLNKVLKQIQ